MSDEQFGECVITRHADGALHVDRADSRILVAEQLLDVIREAGAPDAVLTGDVLTLNGENRRVAYRIGERLPGRGCYVAEQVPVTDAFDARTGCDASF